MNSSYALEHNCALLEQSKTLETLFRLTCGHGDADAALFLENGEEKRWSYRQYEAMTRQYAACLRRAFPEEGYIAISVDTCKEWFSLFWGVILSGHNALLIDAACADEAALRLLREADCHGIITQRRRTLPQDVRSLDFSALVGQAAAEPEDGFRDGAFGQCVALCTSGTTGQSRVFVYDGEAIAEQVLNSKLIYEENRRIVEEANRRSLAFLPFHHVLGFMVDLLWCSFLGYANIYLRDRTPATIIETSRRFQPELVVAVPLLANNLCSSLRKQVARESRLKRALFASAKNFSLNLQRVAPEAGLWLAEKILFRRITKSMLGTEVKCIILGGSHTPQEQLKLLNALGYYTVCGFGMTETAVTSVEMSKRLKKRVSGSVGKPLRSVEYRLKDQESSRVRRGEMLVRGKTVHTGRLHDGRMLPPDTLEGGWYPTGDIVRLKRGDRVFVEGRSKEVIINESGENVYPDELEETFSGLESVHQYTVLGLKKPGRDQHYEDIALVMSVGDRYGDGEAMEALRGRVAQRNRRLPAVKRLTRVLVTPEELPLVNGIKVKRIALREMIAQERLTCRELSLSGAPRMEEEKPDGAPDTAAGQDDRIRRTVRRLYAEALDVKEGSFGDDEHFIDDLGGDSLQVLSVSLKVEEQFGVMLSAEEYGQCTTVNDLTRVIRNHLNGGTEEKAEEGGPVAPITRFEDAPEYQAFARRQQELNASGEGNPYFVCHDSPLRDTSLMAGQEVLNFGSYNYVGMSGRKEVQEAAKAAIDRYGTSASGSRLLAGEKSLYQELEREIADWKHAEDALVCVGGHSTNVTVVGNFCGKGDLIVYDALAHNSIEQGCRLSRAVSKPFPHNDPEALESILKVHRSHFAKVLIVIEGAYSMDGDVADVPAFVALKKKYGCFLMVDEAHSACVIGQTGGGVDEYFHLEPTDVDIKMGTLSKGLGTCGGYLAGRKCLIEYLRYNLPGFVFSVGISPALAAGTLEAIRQLRHNPQIMADMKRNIQCFADCAKKHRFDVCLAGETAILPVMVGRDEDAFALSNEMRRRGVFVPPAVFPAVPKNRARLRFCVISEHRPEQIERALDVLEEVAAALNISLPRVQQG